MHSHSRAPVVLLWAAGAAMSASPAVDIPNWGTAFLHSWYSAFNRGDAAGVAALFSEDARIGEVTGRSAIREALAHDFEKTLYDCAGAFDGFNVLGDLAIAWGHESCSETTRANGAISKTRERWLLVFEQSGAGRWQLTRETYEAL